METFEQVIELSTPPSEKKYSHDLSTNALIFDPKHIGKTWHIYK